MSDNMVQSMKDAIEAADEYARSTGVRVLIEALEAVGYGVVKLPPDDPTNVDRWGNPTFTVGCLQVTAYPERGGHIQLQMTDPDYTCLMWWPGDMREMAATLLAAADAADRSGVGVQEEHQTEAQK